MNANLILNAIINKDMKTVKDEVIKDDKFKSLFHVISEDFQLNEIDKLLNALSFMYFEGMMRGIDLVTEDNNK